MFFITIYINIEKFNINIYTYTFRNKIKKISLKKNEEINDVINVGGNFCTFEKNLLFTRNLNALYYLEFKSI